MLPHTLVGAAVVVVVVVALARLVLGFALRD